MLNPMEMTGRAVIVSGAGQGIGRAISEMLLGLGGDVVMAERNPETLRAASAELRSDRLLPAEPREVAPLICFLLSNAAVYITWENMTVSGCSHMQP